jgi:hypothetical protein
VGKQGEPHLLITGAANQIGEKRWDLQNY